MVAIGSCAVDNAMLLAVSAMIGADQDWRVRQPA
jgi:hypothetical protein